MPAAKKTFRNKLNNLTRKDWLQHPAKFPETLAQEFIEFFTKKGQTVLDPMVGTGSTLVACLRAKRSGIGIELNPKYAAIAKQVVAAEARLLDARTAKKIHAEVIVGDAAEKIKTIHGPVDYVLTSPPYWDMLR